MKKQILFLLLMLISCVNMHADYQAVKYYDFSANNSDGVTIYYSYINNDTELAVKGTSTSEGGIYVNPAYSAPVISIPSEVNGLKVTEIGAAAFGGCASVTQITIPNSVVKIGNYAFMNTPNLTTINMSNNVTYIGRSAFNDCGVQSLVLPSSVTSLGDDALKNCVKLKTIIISCTPVYDPNIYLGRDLKSCTSLESVVFDCPTVQKWNLPESVTSITFTNNVKTVEAYTMGSGVLSISIPNSVTKIESDAFYYSSKITSASFDCSTVGKWLAWKKSLKEISFGEHVSAIDDDAFYGCTGLTSVELSNNITSIGKSAFYNCTAITSFKLSNKLKTIGNFAFYGCGFTSITLPNSLTSIGNGAFGGCSKMTTLTIPENVTSIGEKAFSGCTKLKTLVIPSKVTSIGTNIFVGCTSLTTLTLNCPTIGSQFNNITTLKTLTLGETAKSIANGAFSGCTALTKVVANCPVIGQWPCYLSALKTLEIGDKVVSITTDAFLYTSNYCKSLKEIVVSAGNSNFSAVNGVLYTKSLDAMLCYPFAKSDTEWDTPATMTTMSSDFASGTYPLKKIIFNGNMTTVYIPRNNTNLLTPMTMIFKQSTCPTIDWGSTTNQGTPQSCDFYIPKGTFTSYKTPLITSYTKHIYEFDGDVVWSETIFGAPTDFSTYYDYDGDGVMEYLSSDGFYDKNGNKKGTIALPSKRFSDNSEKIIATPINGKGDLLAYSFYDGSIQRIGGFEGLSTMSLVVDVDNDGRKDLVEKYASGNKFTIRYQQPDGTFKAIEQSATMDADALKAASSSGGGGVASFADGMMVKAPKRGTSSGNRAVEFVGGDSFETGSCTAVDMNDDGILDLINNGTPVLYSYDDNKFFIGTKSRMLCPCDLNGDGEMEYVCYDGSTITLQIRESGTTFSEKTLFTNSNVKQIIYKDFDHDGDIDILAYIYETYNGNFANGTTYFVFFRNDGDLSFKRRERNFAVNYQLKDIKDVDADGFYEMLVIDYTNKLTKLLKIGEDLSVVDTGFEFTGKYGTYSNSSAGYDNPVAVGDFDNDGKMDYRHYVPNTTSGNKYGVFSQAINTAPQKMEAPTAILNADKGRLRINWKQGTDAETSACDLTYELRIGTQPASGDVLFGASLVDGRRRTLEEGNMGRTLSTLFNAKSLKPSKYYISVQAIDGGGRGGAWSDDFVYEHQLTTPVIVSNYINQMSTADTLELDVKAPIENATYKWELSEGIVIEQNGSNAKCVFEHDGNHTVTLAMTVDGKTLNAEPLKINVEPAKYVNLTRNPGYVDINQDGYPEYLGYVNNGKGELEKVLLSYATSNPSSDIYMDYNMDGYPDAISKNTVYINLGEQDNDFDLETQQFDWKYFLKESSMNYISVSDNVSIKSMWFDANNDGYLDNRHCFNDGTNIVWRRYYSTDSKHALYDSRNMPMNKEWNSEIQSYVYLLGYPNYDVNRDGMLDIVEQVREYSYGDSQTSWYVMYKDSTANFNYSAPQLLCTINKFVPSNQWLIDDINNDGYMDIICSPSGENTTNRTKQLIVFKGNPTSQSIEPIIYDIPVYVKEFSALRDYNNDGYLDLCFEGYDTNYDKSNNYLCMFGPDFSMEFVEWTNKASAIWDKYFMIQKDGGYPDGYASNIKNLPPSAPATVAAKQTKDGLLITWSDAQDDHTPAMQMRYNISVKRKGKKGDNSFVISPMNGLKDAATICGNIMYKKSTQMLVPASVLTAGETYEIQVQAIDLWNQHSPMTPVVEFTMVSDGYIDMAEQVAVGMETSVKYVGTNADSYSLNAGADGTIFKDEGNGSYIVKWSSEGVKNITLTAGSTTVKSAITVVKPVDLTFSVAGQVFAGAPLVINVSDEMAAQPKNIGMRVVNNNRVKVDYVIGSKAAVVTFPEIGTYELEAYSTDPIKGNSYKQTVEVSAEMPAAVIEQVDVDDETGFYTVNWDTATLPAGISKVAINKEGKTLGAFNNLTTIDAATGRYIDKSSTPAMMASRYHIQLIADNGQTSEVSAVHKPLHVMIAKAVKGYNLIWDHYEGLNVGSYNILRGSSPDNLQTVAQVAGSINSYTDTSAPDGTSYYAVTFSKTTAQAASRRVKSAETTVGSNVISTEEAVSVQQAQSIELIVLDDDNTLSDNHPELQLYYMLLPTYTTIGKVSWEIVSGADIATIDINGKLRATGGSGTVTVRVSTIDGSELSDEINIVCTATDVITDIHEIAVTTDSEAVLKEVRYFTLDGKRIDTAVKGQVVIEWSIYSNGHISVRKRMKE